MSSFLKVLKRLYVGWRHEREELTLKKQRARIAKLFNDYYTYVRVYNGVEKKNAWMCPDCNKIHGPVTLDGLTGLQYPRCCSTPAGHRLYENIRTH